MPACACAAGAGRCAEGKRRLRHGRRAPNPAQARWIRACAGCGVRAGHGREARPDAGARRKRERERATVTSVQAGLPAEFKHITKRRRRN